MTAEDSLFGLCSVQLLLMLLACLRVMSQCLTPVGLWECTKISSLAGGRTILQKIQRFVHSFTHSFKLIVNMYPAQGTILSATVMS